MRLFSVSRALRQVNFVLLRMQNSALRRPGAWLLSLLIVTVLSVVSASRLKMLLSIDDLIDTDFKTYHQLTNLNQAFSDKNNLLLVVSPKDRGTRMNKAQLCDVQLWLYRELSGNEAFRRVLTTYGARRPRLKGDALTFPPLIELTCSVDYPGDTEEIRRGLDLVRESPWSRILVAKDGDDIALNFYLNDTAKDRRFGAFDTQVVKQIMDSFETKVLAKHSELQASWAGVAAYQYYLKQGFDQTGVLNLGMFMLILLLFWLCYRSLRGGFLFIGTIVVTMILIYGGLAATNCPIDVLTNTLSLMLVLSSLEDFIYILNQARTRSARLGWRYPFRRLLMPGFFTSLTTAIGFGSLMTSNLGIIRRFGGWAGAAAMIEWSLVFIFLPALLQRYPRWRRWLDVQSIKPTILSWFERVSAWRIPRYLAFALLGVYLVGAVGLQRLVVSDAPTSVFPKDHPARRDLDYLSASRGWQSEVSLVLKNYYDRSANEKIIERFSKLDNVILVEDTYRIEDYLTHGLSVIDAEFVRMLWRDSEPAQRLISSDRQTRAVLYIRDTNTVQIDRLLDAVKTICPNGECHLAGSLVSYAEFGDRVLHTLFESLGVSLLLVAGILLCLLRAKGAGGYFAAISSAMWGPFAILCVFYVFQIPVTYVTSTFAAILVGLAGDNTIQYVYGSKQSSLSAGVDIRGATSVQIIFMMIVLAVVLLGSYFAPLRTLGLLFMLGFALSLLGDLWVFKGLLGKGKQA